MRVDPDAVLPEGSFGHAGVVLLLDATGRVLLQQREDDEPPVGRGRWGFAGGTWQTGESPRQTALREMEEETGIRLAALRYFESFEFGVGTHGFPVVWHVFFSLEPVDSSAIQLNEGLAFMFWPQAECAGLPMNPSNRAVLDAFFASDKYRGARTGPFTGNAATIIELDRWGRVLLQLRDRDLPAELFPGTWTLPGGAMESDESPDAAVLREFEEETGHLLEEVRFFRAFPKHEVPGQVAAVQHVFFADADLDVEHLDCNEGLELRYFAPDELAGIPVTPWTQPVLEAFLESGAYKGLFH